MLTIPSKPIKYSYLIISDNKIVGFITGKFASEYYKLLITQNLSLSNKTLTYLLDSDSYFKNDYPCVETSYELKKIIRKYFEF